MKKTIAWLTVALFAVAIISSCGSRRRGDKCPGVGQVSEQSIQKV